MQRSHSTHDIFVSRYGFDASFHDAVAMAIASRSPLSVPAPAHNPEINHVNARNIEGKCFFGSDGCSFDPPSGDQYIVPQESAEMMVSDSSLQPLMHQVPLDEMGRPTSVGSLLHSIGKCKVCVFAHSGSCSSGVSCSFCHLPHRRSQRKTGMRPCKGKRDRYRKFVACLEHEIEIEPDNFDVSKVELPPSITSNEAAHSKLLAKLHSRLEQEKVKRQSQRLPVDPNGEAWVKQKPIRLSF